MNRQERRLADRMCAKAGRLTRSDGAEVCGRCFTWIGAGGAHRQLPVQF